MLIDRVIDDGWRFSDQPDGEYDYINDQLARAVPFRSGSLPEWHSTPDLWVQPYAPMWIEGKDSTGKDHGFLVLDHPEGEGSLLMIAFIDRGSYHIIPYGGATERGGVRLTLFSKKLDAACEKDAEFVDTLLSTFILPLNVIQLLNCKNVTQERHTADEKVQKKRRKRGKPPLLDYHTLKLRLPATATKRKSGEKTGIQHRVHLCRGNFAHYGEDSKLFGKLTGTYWRPAHVKGSKKLGIVGKRYDITAKEEIA